MRLTQRENLCRSLQIGAPFLQRWFDYAYSKKDDAVYLSHYISGEQVFTLHLYSEFMEWHSAEGDEDQNISAKVQIFENEVYIPMLAFAENLGKAGYEAEIVLNGETHTFGKQSDATAEPPTSTDPSEPPSGQTEQAWQIPEWSESKALIDDWRDGPVSLEVPMKERGNRGTCRNLCWLLQIYPQPNCDCPKRG